MFFLKWVLLSLFILAATMSVPDRWVPGGSVEVTVLSEEKAKGLFEEFISHKEIPYEYAVDGCYIRASAMAMIAEEKKYRNGQSFCRRRYRY
ncbi:protein-glutamine glutaminase family protein [Bdellovibrio sp. HCB209]|uniref:protein-glutamine glutaminase family protein n=1 Tax=Bdellovibrio sp. HCB209 TaxID=3394354 RepID=UPI0039B468C9